MNVRSSSLGDNYRLTAIVRVLQDMDACPAGLSYVQELGAYTPQDMWDRCEQPYVMAWYLQSLRDFYEGGVGPNRATPAACTSLAIALARLSLPLHEATWHYLDYLAVLNYRGRDRSNAQTAEPFTKEHKTLFLLEDRIPLSEPRNRAVARVTLLVAHNDALLEYALNYSPWVSRGRRDTGMLCRVIRAVFPVVPLPGADSLYREAPDERVRTP